MDISPGRALNRRISAPVRALPSHSASDRGPAEILSRRTDRQETARRASRNGKQADEDDVIVLTDSEDSAGPTVSQ